MRSDNNGKGPAEKSGNRNTVKSLFLTPENNDKRNEKEEKLKKEEKINQELPAALIPGQKEFNRKRLEDIKNKEKDYVRTRAEVSSAKPASAAIKFVKKIFKKK